MRRYVPLCKCCIHVDYGIERIQGNILLAHIESILNVNDMCLAHEGPIMSCMASYGIEQMHDLPYKPV